MYTVKFTSAFKKNYKLMKKRGMDISLLDDVIEVLRRGKELDGKYKDHVLKGEYASFHECHVKPDWLLIYLIENNILTLTLVNTGSHALTKPGTAITHVCCCNRLYKIYLYNLRIFSISACISSTNSWGASTFTQLPWLSRYILMPSP